MGLPNIYVGGRPGGAPRRPRVPVDPVLSRKVMPAELEDFPSLHRHGATPGRRFVIPNPELQHESLGLLRFGLKWRWETPGLDGGPCRPHPSTRQEQEDQKTAANDPVHGPFHRASHGMNGISFSTRTTRRGACFAPCLCPCPSSLSRFSRLLRLKMKPSWTSRGL